MEEKTEKELVHIGIMYPESFPDTIIDNMLEEINAEGLLVKTSKHETLIVLAALEWVMPAFFTAYLLKPYFDGFLKKAGEDHYLILKSWLKKFLSEFRSIKVTTLTATQSFLKNIEKDSQSKAVAIYVQTKNDRRIKLLFDNELSQADWDNSLDLMMDYLIENYKDFPNDKLTAELKELTQESYFEIYAYINKETKEWVFVDNKGMLKLNRERKSDETKKDEN